MTTRPGHEDCWRCTTSGQPMWPDCDTDGRSCTILPRGVQYRCGICKQSYDRATTTATPEEGRAWLAGPTGCQGGDMITATMTDEQVVARLTLPCTITGLDARCASLEEVYGARLFIRGDGTSW